MKAGQSLVTPRKPLILHHHIPKDPRSKDLVTRSHEVNPGHPITPQPQHPPRNLGGPSSRTSSAAGRKSLCRRHRRAGRALSLGPGSPKLDTDDDDDDEGNDGDCDEDEDALPPPPVQQQGARGFEGDVSHTNARGLDAFRQDRGSPSSGSLSLSRSLSLAVSDSLH